MPLSYGKKRGLAQCSTENDVFSILALDHRSNLKKALNPDNQNQVTFSSLVEFKSQVISALAPFTSAVLVDPEIGTVPSIAQEAVPGNVGLIIAVESTGYTGKPNERSGMLLSGWGVDKVRRIGASGVKLLIYYHPESKMAKRQEELIEQVAEKCILYDIALFLEPLSYSLDPDRTQLLSSELREIVIETTRRLTPLGIDVLKVEFPLNVTEVLDESVWLSACSDLNSVSQVPWALLSAGVDFEIFLRQVIIACKAGASGVLAGRAVWKEAAMLTRERRSEFLHNRAAQRMASLTALCNALARPWKSGLSAAGNFEESWYIQYEGLEGK